MNLRPFIDEALIAPKHLHNQPRRRGYVTLTRAIKDCHHWREVEDIKVVDPDLGTPWSPALALDRLDVRQIPYEALNPRWDAYARGRELAIAEDVSYPLRALAHELMHIACGHTYASTAGDRSKPIREVQAEVGAFVLLALMGAIEAELFYSSRQYISAWLNKADEPLTDEHLHQMALAIETVWQAGT